MDWIKSALWPCIQPVLRETGNEEFPYAIPGGTLFLVHFHGRAFAITARHALFPLTPICLFPTDSSQCILPIENVFYVPRNNLEDDFADFAIIEVDIRKSLNEPDLGLTNFIDLEAVAGNWLGVASELEFIVLGYPLECSTIDITEHSITTSRIMLKGRYQGLSTYSRAVHVLSLSENPQVTDFNGFSGSPVFASSPGWNKPTTLFLCGMALRGSSASGLIYFVDREILMEGIAAKPAPYKVIPRVIR